MHICTDVHFFCQRFNSFNLKFTEFIDSEKSQLSHYLVIGNPVVQSLSPLMHNIALKHNKLGGEYLAVSLSHSEVNTAIAHFTNESFLGANITIPHKELFVDVVDELSETAKEIGVINTIIKKGNKLIGDNTDAYGFIQPLRDYEDELIGERAIIFGAGGATQAIIFALKHAGVEELVLVSRRPEMHQGSPEQGITRCNYENWPAYAEEATLIVNATPLGMTPNTDSSPVADQEVEILAGKICYDIVYNPRQTKFLTQASSTGAVTIGGLDMLIYQGAKSFNLWTGLHFPIDDIKAALYEVLPA